MTEAADKILSHLQKLVSFDTQNPPRNIQSDSDIFNYLQAQLPGFNFTLADAGNGCISLLAVRGNPEILFNFHIDTVPVAKGWQREPLVLNVEGEKVYGLGACDIKGASACMLAAAANTTSPLALLFSSDEEAGSSIAVKEFLKTPHGFKKAIIAEPTLTKAVTAHRGIQTAVAIFKGISGHASEQRALCDNAIHKAVKWLTAAINWAEQLQTNKHDELQGLPFNTGTISGGVKANMIAADCEIKIGFRPLPGQNSTALLDEISALSDEITLTPAFYGATLPAANQNFKDAISGADSLIEQCQLNKAAAVNFWTEAALFSEAGITAIVFGPGDIAQAHTADEWVTMEQLERVYEHYIKIINTTYVNSGETQ